MLKNTKKTSEFFLKEKSIFMNIIFGLTTIHSNYLFGEHEPTLFILFVKK